MDGKEWIQDTENRIIDLEQQFKANSEIIIDTMENVQTAIQQGQIRQGALVVTTKLK